MSDLPTPQLAAADIYSILAELQTPLAELGALAGTSGQSEVQAVANQVLRLFNGLVYAQRLEGQSAEQLDWRPASLAAATESIVLDLKPLARLYNVSLELLPSPQVSGASLVRPAFDCATYCLLSGLLSRLQNHPRAKLRVRITNPDQPRLEAVSPSISLASSDFESTGRRVRQKLQPARVGLASGLLVASLIYRRLGNALSLISGGEGRGVRVAFRPTRQMSLVESIS